MSLPVPIKMPSQRAGQAALLVSTAWFACAALLVGCDTAGSSNAPAPSGTSASFDGVAASSTISNGPTSSAASARPASASLAQTLTAGVAGKLNYASQGNTRSVALSALLSRSEPRLITTRDPYYKQLKRFWAVPLRVVMRELEGDEEAAASYQFIASDGYSVSFSAEQAYHPAAYLAFADASVVGTSASTLSTRGFFEPIGEKQVDPGPLYVVWQDAPEFKDLQLQDEKAFPRPWALSTVQRLGAEDVLKHIAPAGGFAAGSLEQAGFVIFRGDCLRCHSINQEGGKLGPELNVPQNILEYRPESQLRAFIRDPRQFRYSAMPQHLDLSEKDMDGLIAYLRAMSQHKFDPQADGTASAVDPAKTP